jgi:hypothetical protein
MRYTNYFTEPIHFGLTQELRPLEKETYKADLGLAELGLGLRRFKRADGITYFWGADLGASSPPVKAPGNPLPMTFLSWRQPCTAHGDLPPLLPRLRLCEVRRLRVFVLLCHPRRPGKAQKGKARSPRRT